VGVSRDAIVGGVTDPAHPYVVMVGDSTEGFCSGTLISKRTVITAGHCWFPQGQDPISTVYFDVGTPERRKAVSVAQSVRSPGFDPNTLSHDLTVVQLSEDAPVQPAALLRETIDSTFVGPDFTWVGYGYDDSKMNGFGTRRVARFPINLIGPVADIPPLSAAPPTATTSIDETQFYFRRPDENTCVGDSGGPAFVVRGGLERHAGVTSFGDHDCVYDGVDARTDATAMAWIDQMVNELEPGNACKADGVCNASCVSTTPAPLGTLEDPDCADQHCGADGVCVLGCQVVDSDCASMNMDRCAHDGICEPGCAPADLDCAGVVIPDDSTGQPHVGESGNGTVPLACGSAEGNGVFVPMMLLVLLQLTRRSTLSTSRVVSSTRPWRR
jgi:hypothetical protein